MSTPNAEEIARLIREGLDRYGLGEVSEAIATWERVLALDPENEQVSDYIKNADRRKARATSESPSATGSFHALVADGQSLVAENHLEGALQLFSQAENADLAALEIGATVDLLRSRLLRQYREEIGGRDAVPTLCADPEALKRINLPADAGFMVSLVDGKTGLEDLVSLSGMDKFEAIQILRNLRSAGVLENRG